MPEPVVDPTKDQNQNTNQPKVHIPRSLDSIQLPEEDANKPAEINLNPDQGDDDVVVDPAQAKKEKEEAEAAKKAEEEKKAAEEAGKTDEQKKAEADAKAKEEEEKQKLTPFHEHPDWKKMQDENKRLNDELQQQKGRVDALLESGKTTQEEKKTAIKTAEERIQEDLDNGWQPKSQVEIAQRNNKYLREELEAKEKAKQEEKSKESEKVGDVQKQFETAITTTMSELKVSEDEEKKIYGRVTELRQKGLVRATPENIGEILKMAHNQLKGEGAITAAPVKTAEQIKAEEEKAAAEAAKQKDEESKRNANSRISRSGGGGDGQGKPEKKPLTQLRRTLDDIVMSHRAELDGN